MRNEPFRKLYMQIKAFCPGPVRVFFLFFLSLIFITFSAYSTCFTFHFLDIFPFSFSPLLFPFSFILSPRSSCSPFHIMLSSYEDDFWFRPDGKKLSFQQCIPSLKRQGDHKRMKGTCPPRSGFLTSLNHVVD